MRCVIASESPRIAMVFRHSGGTARRSKKNTRGRPPDGRTSIASPVHVKQIYYNYLWQAVAARGVLKKGKEAACCDVVNRPREWRLFAADKYNKRNIKQAAEVGTTRTTLAYLPQSWVRFPARSSMIY